MKKFFTVVLMIISLCSVAVPALASDYVGNSNSGKFHYTSCQWARKISSSHRVYFEDRDDAIAAGYIPCKVCRP